MSNDDLASFRVPTHYVDSDAEPVRNFVADVLGSSQATPSDTEKTIMLFDAVRDRIKYDPFHLSFDPQDYRASAIAMRPSNYCVPKAIMLTAALRAAGVPAAVGFADVRNHLNSPKLAELMGTDLFIYHGYTAVWLDGRLFKITPAFNTELCVRFGVKELRFDGCSNALFHEYDAKDRRHMEYVNDRGWFADPPIERLLSDMRETYPKLWQRSQDISSHSLPEFAPGN